MNIFYLNHVPKQCAREHVDKHVVKMILEYAQLLSTAHRVLDGVQYIDASSGRKMKRWKLENSFAGENLLYKATHINHPSAVWVRQSKQNYKWLTELLLELCKEYTNRYGRVHKCESDELVKWLYMIHPENIPNGDFTQPTPAMPDLYKVDGDSIQSYQNYYMGAKRSMASWKNRETPTWWK